MSGWYSLSVSKVESAEETDRRYSGERMRGLGINFPLDTRGPDPPRNLMKEMHCPTVTLMGKRQLLGYPE